jgi:hypothetical protein
VGASRFSDELDAWVHGDQSKTLGSLSEVFGEKAFAVIVVVLMFPAALPLPTGGVTHVLEAITVVVAGQLVLGRQTLWLPRRWAGRELGSLTTDRVVPILLRAIRRVERFSRPRGARLLERRLTLRICGVLLGGLAVAAGFAPPFSGLDTLPAMGAVAIALAIVLEDIVVLAVGLAIGGAGTVLILTVGAALVHAIRSLL